MSSGSIVTSRRRVEIQSTSEMSPYFTMTKCNKQFITLGHCEIWRHFTRALYFHSPSARDNTVATREISCHISR